MFHPTNFSPIGTNLLEVTSSTSCQLRINTTALWRVTLGFLPIYANLYKRLYDQHALDRLELQEARAQLKVLTERELKRQAQELGRENYESNSLVGIEEVYLVPSPIASSSSSTVASLPSVEWSDISESTDEGSWTDYTDTGVITEHSSSDSSSDFTKYSSDYAKWRNGNFSEGGTTDLHWMERFSRAVFGEI